MITNPTNLHREQAGEIVPADFIARVLRLASYYDIHDYLFWNSDLQFAVNVNDVFYWGAADAESITPRNIDALERAIKDCEAVSETEADWGCALFAARNRQLRPQGASYPKDAALWPLFDAAGPERETGHGNPYRPGEYKPRSALSSRDAEVREVLAGVGVKLSNGWCWCHYAESFDEKFTHGPNCERARALYAKLQPADKTAGE